MTRTLAFALAAMAVAGAAGARQPLEVADTIITGELVREYAGPRRATGVTISPDGRHFAVRVVRGDLEANGLWIEVHSGPVAHPEQIRRVARLFSQAYGSDRNPFHPAANSWFQPTWIDGRRLTFLWEDSNDIIQVTAIDVESGSVSWLTESASDVTNFAADPRGYLIYSSQVPVASRAAELIARGFTVEAADAMGLINGEPGAVNMLDTYYDGTYWLVRPGLPPFRLAAHLRWGMAFRPVFGSRYALIDSRPASIPQSWTRYPASDMVGRLDLVREALRDPDAWFGRQLTQLHLVDLETGAVRPLWDAPTANPYVLKASWSPDGSRLLLSPVLLPDRTGLHTVDLDVTQNTFRLLPVEGAAGTIGWEAADRIVIDGLRYRLADGVWTASGAADPAESAIIPIEIRDDLNIPPAVYAGGRRIFDPNPGFADRFTLGRVERIEFADVQGRTRRGLLYRPVGERRDRRYPLVIQSIADAPVGGFSLTGRSSAHVSIAAAQPLANRGIAVLQLELMSIPGVTATPREPAAQAEAYEAAIEHLDRIGLIDPARVGLAGFSRTGWHVSWTLTHRDFPYAAAIISDNIFAGYLEGTFLPGGGEMENGGPLAGAGLESWLETAPPFAAERLRTPLRMQKESGGLGGVATKWEFFARARRAGAPIEYYVIPRIDRGTHNLRNPGQVLASRQGAVEWWDFWLNGRDPLDPATRDRWHALRQQRDALTATPRPPLLDWSARPVTEAPDMSRR